MDEASIVQMQESFASTMQFFSERIAELELDLEEEGYSRISGADTKFEFSREALRLITRESRLLFLKNPLIRRGVLTRTNYVFGQGMTIKARNANVDAIVQAFLADPKNKAELTADVAQQERDQDLQVEANLFFVFFRNTNGDTRIRTIPFDEIEDVICNPEDRREPWYYLRRVGNYGKPDTWTLYPDFQYRSQQKPARLKLGTEHANIEANIEWEKPVYHVRVNPATDSPFGVSTTYSSQDWAKAYNTFLEDWATIVHAYARWAWKLTAKASKIPAIKAQLESRLGTGGAIPQPAPATGSVFASESTTMEPFRTAGATTSAEDGRRLLLMTCAGSGIFEHYYGDPATGNLATAKSMDRPMELDFINWQRLWQSVWETVLQFVIEVKAESGTTPITGYYVEPSEDPWGEHRFIFNADAEDEMADGEQPVDTHVDIIFPDLLERDVDVAVGALVSAATLNGMPLAGTLSAEYLTRQLLITLGEKSVEETMKVLFPPDEAETTAETEAEAVREALTRIKARAAKFLEAERDHGDDECA